MLASCNDGTTIVLHYYRTVLVRCRGPICTVAWASSIQVSEYTAMQSYDENVEPIGTLQRALSRRGSIGGDMEDSEPAVQLPFDRKKMLPHIAEEAGLSEEVTLSSPGAMATVLRQQSMVRVVSLYCMYTVYMCVLLHPNTA